MSLEKKTEIKNFRQGARGTGATHFGLIDDSLQWTELGQTVDAATFLDDALIVFDMWFEVFGDEDQRSAFGVLRTCSSHTIENLEGWTAPDLKAVLPIWRTMGLLEERCYDLTTWGKKVRAFNTPGEARCAYLLEYDRRRGSSTIQVSGAAAPDEVARRVVRALDDLERPPAKYVNRPQTAQTLLCTCDTPVPHTQNCFVTTYRIRAFVYPETSEFYDGLRIVLRPNKNAMISYGLDNFKALIRGDMDPMIRDHVLMTFCDPPEQPDDERPTPWDPDNDVELMAADHGYRPW